MVRKATLTSKAASELRLKIDCALQEETRRRLGRSAVDFLISIREIAASSVVRLSKKQRDTTEEILAKAFSDEPVRFLEGEAIVELVELYLHATGDEKVSALEENVLSRLRRRSDEPIIAVSERLWRIIGEIKQKTRFGLPDEPSPSAPDSPNEYEDPDGLPSESDQTEVDHAREWVLLGANETED